MPRPFSPLQALCKITLLNPVWVHSKNSGKPFYAILHRIDSQKLVVQAISNLQALPGGDIKLLCDTVVQIVRELTGYDPVEDGGG
ncbi:hypothetical protein Hanom_Chr09g00850781 [Helianthus anomalus]